MAWTSDLLDNRHKPRELHHTKDPKGESSDSSIGTMPSTELVVLGEVFPDSFLSDVLDRSLLGWEGFGIRKLAYIGGEKLESSLPSSIFKTLRTHTSRIEFSRARVW